MERVIDFFLSLLRNRKLRVHILTLFLSLQIISSAIIMTFFYLRNAAEIMTLTREAMDRVGFNVQIMVNDLIDDIKDLPLFVSDYLSQFHEFSPSNQSLTHFLLSAVKTYPQLHAMFLNSADGHFFIEAIDFTIIHQHYYQSDPSKKLPEGILYALRIVDYSKHPHQETWEYKDEDFNTLTQETFTSTFEPKNLHWYVGAEKTRALFWSDVYVYDPTGDTGIAVAMPVLDKQDNFIGVIGADLPLSLLSQYLSRHKIGKSGKIYLLNHQGKIIVPENTTNKIVTSLYNKYAQTGEKNLVIKEGGEKYLTHIDTFSASFKDEWFIAIVVPLNDFFGPILRARRQTILIALAILLGSLLILIYFSKKVSEPITSLTQEVDKITHFNLKSEKRVKSHIYEIIHLDRSIAAMRVVLRSFGRYVPKEIVKPLMIQGKEITLGGEKKEITVFFSDIADFTPIAESYPIEDFMPALNAYFDQISTIILNKSGTIDKYIGDSVMAFWGAPREIPHQEISACQAALSAQKAISEFNRQRIAEGKPPFMTRIGMHCGTVVVGNIGTSERMNYTIMGDVVNASARLQQVNKIYHTSIIISEELYQKVQGQFLTRPLDIVSVKGKSHQLKIYELVAQLSGEEQLVPKPSQVELCLAFTAAYETYQRGDLKEAKHLFLLLSQKFPHDFPTKLFLDRLANENV